MLESIRDIIAIISDRDLDNSDLGTRMTSFSGLIQHLENSVAGPVSNRTQKDADEIDALGSSRRDVS